MHASVDEKILMEGENASFCLFPGCDPDLHGAGYKGKDINKINYAWPVNN